jgi:hypothetical protein
MFASLIHTWYKNYVISFVTSLHIVRDLLDYLKFIT